MSVGLSLPVVAIADIASPAELFRCAHFHNAILSAGACLSRQGARKTVRTGSHGKTHQKEIVPEAFKYCASGECQDGVQVKARLVDYVVPDKAGQIRERNRVLAPARLKRVEEQIAAKVASGELRVAEEARVIDRLPRASEVPLPELDEESKEEEQSMETVKCSVPGCKQECRANSKSGKCRWCLRGYVLTSPRHGVLPPSESNEAQRTRWKKHRATAQLNRNGDPAQPRAPKNGAPAPAPVPPDDVVALLVERQEHHLREAERIGKALEVLKG